MEEIVPLSEAYGSLVVLTLKRAYDQQQRLLSKSNKSFTTAPPRQLRLFVCIFWLAFFCTNIAIAICVCEFGSFFLRPLTSLLKCGCSTLMVLQPAALRQASDDMKHCFCVPHGEGDGGEEAAHKPHLSSASKFHAL